MKTRKDPNNLPTKIEKCSQPDCNGACMKPQHTPTPWKVTQNGSYCEISGTHGFVTSVAKTNGGEIDAAFIVRAVNSHEELVQWAKDMSSYVLRMYKNPDLTVQDAKSVFETILDGADEVIAKAEGK